MKNQRWMGWTLLTLAGCAGGSRSATDLEAQVRALRGEQEAQARRIAQLEGRVAMAEDTVRTAERAQQALRRGTVRIEDGAAIAARSDIEDIPTSLHEDEPEPEAPEVPGTVRPVVRAQGRPAPEPVGAPIVVRPDERLPVVPVPNLPEEGSSPSGARPASERGSGRGPSSAIEPSLQNGLPSLVAGSGSGLSSARDPRSTMAYEAAVAEARSGQCARAIESLGSFLTRWPDHPNGPSAMYWRAECVLASGDARRASEQFESVLAAAPTPHLSASALFKLAQCHRRLGDATRARAYSERLQREFAATEPAARARAEEIR